MTSTPNPQRVQLPPNNLPLPRLFVGRDSEVALVDDALRVPAGCASLIGDGGVGKTEIARYYAHSSAGAGRYPGGVWWYRPAPGRLTQVVARLRNLAPKTIGDMLESLLPAASDDSLAMGLSRALGALGAPALLVVDDAGTSRTPEFQPQGLLRLLLTASAERHARGTIVRVGVMSEHEVAARLNTIVGTVAHRVLVAIACHLVPPDVYAPEALPLAWIQGEVRAGDAEATAATLAKLGLLHVDEHRGLVQIHHVVAAQVRKSPDAADRVQAALEPHGVATRALRLGEFHGQLGGWGSAYRLFQAGLRAAKRASDRALISEVERLLAHPALEGAGLENT